MAVVTGIDILGIQRYVFVSNRLRDVLAASWMVDQVMKRQPDSLLQWGMTNDRVLLAAGGNAILKFDNLKDARTWAARYTRWLQDKAPGLETVVAHRPYDGHSLAWGLEALAVDLARAKLERCPNAPQLGLSVTASCSVTGLPAMALDRHERVPISRGIETLRRDDIQHRANKRWHRYLSAGFAGLDQARGWRAEFPLELDLMGRSHGETSLLGVVHVDGNGVGKAIKNWLERCYDEGAGNEKVRAEYREWSRAIEALGERVLHSTVQRVLSRVVEEQSQCGEKKWCALRGTPYELGFPLRDWRNDKTGKTTENSVLLPLRPILLGGDDLTFVCDGRIALDLAATALREFEAHPIPHLGKDGGTMKLTACAGVALVKAHAPFDRSYELAQRLCKSAKGARLEANQQEQTDTGCWLDWHVGSARPTDTVEDVRQRDYRNSELTMRPYPLAGFQHRKQSWIWVDTEVLGPGKTVETARRGFRGAECWAGSRNRVKRLGSLVPAERGAIERQIQVWNAINGHVKLPADLPDAGFIGRRTPLLDAIELQDLHVRLEPDPTVAGTGAREEETR